MEEIWGTRVEALGFRIKTKMVSSVNGEVGWRGVGGVGE